MPARPGPDGALPLDLQYPVVEAPDPAPGTARPSAFTLSRTALTRPSLAGGGEEDGAGNAGQHADGRPAAQQDGQRTRRPRSGDPIGRRRN